MKLRTLNEAAEALGTNRTRLRKGVVDGRYPCLKWGNRYLVDLEVVGPIIEEEDARNSDPSLSLRACAEAIGVKPTTLKRMVESGMVPCRRSGGHYCFRLREVLTALDDLMTEKKED